LKRHSPSKLCKFLINFDPGTLTTKLHNHSVSA
jgi:hypothetical protein